MKLLTKYLPALFGSFLLSSSFSHAASTQWFETDGAKLRLVSETDRDENGIIHAALQIELEPGWKTYWREPGSSGIPPHINFSESKNLKGSRVLFPAPSMIDDGYARYAGYNKSVTLPIELKDTGEHLHLISDVFIGVCSDICVPVSVKIDLDLAQLGTSASEKAIIETARFELPRQQADDFKLNLASFNKASTSLDLNIELPAFYPKSVKPEIFIHGPMEISMAQPKLVQIDGKVAKFETEIFEKFKDSETLSGQMYVLLKLGQRSVETTIDLGALN